MKIFTVFLAFLFFFMTTSARALNDHGRLIISGNGRFLQYEDGTPFFWLGDTAWELFHRLTLEEINSYFSNRKEKGFNIIQAVILAEMDGLRNPNRYGEVPFIDLNPEKPNDKYFDLVDNSIKLADDYNLVIGLLPTWGDKVLQLWGTGPVIFNRDNAFKYGLWLGKRYSGNSNLVWILGGDRPAVSDSINCTFVWRAMAEGILKGSDNNALITYHPSGGENSTSQFFNNEPWLDLNMIQSGHGGGHDVKVWEWINRDWNLEPIKPTLDAEPNYEDHPVNPWPEWNPENGYYRDYDVRKQIYRSVFAGACGVTYGHHSIWQFWSSREERINHADRFWTEALDRPGAYQAGYLKRLIESRPMLNRIPDQSIIKDGQGEKAEYICSFRDSLNSYLMVYMPVGKSITLNLEFMNSGKINCWWFNPRTCEAVHSGILDRTNRMSFTPPSIGSGNDWVLVIDNAEYNYGMPGK